MMISPKAHGAAVGCAHHIKSDVSKGATRAEFYPVSLRPIPPYHVEAIFKQTSRLK
jgi:hypothetical protein